MSWQQRFNTWLGLSEPGGRRAQLEDWIVARASTFSRIYSEQASQRDARGGFRQIRSQDRHLAALPVWAEFSVDVYEAPVSREPRTTRFGYTLSYRVTEADGSKWNLVVDPEAEADPAWREVRNESVR